MAIAFQTIDESQYTTSVTDFTLSITTPAANELIVVASSNENPSGGYDPTSVEDQNTDTFTNIQRDYTGSTSNACGGMWYKIADGDETSVIVKWPTGSTQGYAGALIYSGVDTSAPLDTSTEVTTYIATSTTSAVASATASVSSGLALHQLTCERSLRWTDASTSVSTGTKRGASYNSAITHGVFAEDIFASSGAKSTTFSTSTGGDEVYLISAIFKEAGGGPTIEEMYIRDGGVFVQATPHIRVGGVWQEVDAYVRTGGVWVQVHEKP